MLEDVLDLERDAFFTLNGSHTAFWDNFMWLYSYKFTWVFFYLCFFIILIYKRHWKEILLIVFTISLLVLLCDQVSSSIFKPIFQRFRPTHHPEFMNEVVTVFDYRGGRYGFISGHSANSFGFATLTGLIFRNYIFTFMIFIFALVTAYSRIYLGVHFISDVVVGALVGIIIGYCVYRFYVIGEKKFLKIKEKKKIQSNYTSIQAYSLVLAYVSMIIALLAFNKQLVKIVIDL